MVPSERGEVITLLSRDVGIRSRDAVMTSRGDDTSGIMDRVVGGLWSEEGREKRLFRGDCGWW